MSGKGQKKFELKSSRKEPATTLSIPLEKYQALVDLCAAERLDYPIANGSALHARILIDKLFNIARTSVYLVTGSLRQASTENIEIYAHARVIESAKKFLRSSPAASLSIVIQGGEIDGGAENRFLREIVDDAARQGVITVYRPKQGVLSSHETPHFMVTDSSAYRFETGKDASPRNESISAVANFGDDESARTLSNIFTKVLALVNADDNLNSRDIYPRNSAVPA